MMVKVLFTVFMGFLFGMVVDLKIVQDWIAIHGRPSLRNGNSMWNLKTGMRIIC